MTKKPEKPRTRIFLFIDEATGEIWPYVYEGEGEPILIETASKLRKLLEDSLQKDDDKTIH